MDLLDRLRIDVPCPLCGYETDVEFLSVRLQEQIFCPCCKARIQLVDADSSAHTAQKGFQSALDGLTRELAKLR